MITETLRDKLRKVLALAQSGQAGERDAARNLLDKLLKENNLTIDDISDDSVEVHWFKTGRNADMNELLAQIYFMVTDTHETTTYTSSARKGCIGFKVTAVQAADMEAYYSVLAPALRKEMNRYRRWWSIRSARSTGSSRDPRARTATSLRRRLHTSVRSRSSRTPSTRSISAGR